MSMAVAYGLKKRQRMAKGGEVDKKEPEEVGKTRSGKSIYPHHKDPRHKGFTKEDHLDAMEHHVNAQGPLNSELHRLGRKYPSSDAAFGTPMKTLASKRDYHAKMAQAHSDSSDDPENFAHGGRVDGDDMVSRIMKKRGCYSEGGMVANDTTPLADEEDADYDLLAKGDDLEFHETGANSGDELGNAELETEDHDLVSRIMRSRAKKDRLPRPA